MKTKRDFLIVIGMIMAIGMLVLALLFSGCGGVYAPVPIPSALEPTGTETGETAKLILRINLGETETNSRALNPGERSTLTELQKKKINRIYFSLFGENSYYGEAWIEQNLVIECALANIKPGAYRLYVGGNYYIDDYNQYTLFEHQREVVIIPGVNEISTSLTLYEWQPVALSLPEQYASEEKGFFAEGKYRNADDDGTGGFGSYFAVQKDKTSLIGTVPLAIMGKMEIEYRDKRYLVDSDIILSALINDRPVSLSECQWEPITSAALTVGFTANYAVVPTDYPTIQAAIDAVSSGTTIKLNPGTYNESIVLKPGIRIEGNSSYPYQSVIQSDAENTIFGETGGTDNAIFEAEICGVTIRNGYENILNYKNWTYAAVFCNLGFDLKMDHCIVESSGVGDCVVGNYTKMELTNLTLIGTAENSKIVNGISFSNTSSNNIIENIIFCNITKAVVNVVNSVSRHVNHSVFWNTSKGDIYFSETNCDGNPEFLDDWWNKYTPSNEAPAVKAVMERDKSGNYPGALMPQKPAPAEDGKG